MANIPTQPQVDAILDDIDHYAIRLRELWKWASPSFYDRPRRGSVNPTTTRPPEDHEMKPRSAAPGSFSDPTASALAMSDKVRRLGRHAGREIVDARNRLGSAIADLNDALRELDPPEGPEVADVRLRPHPAGKRDLAQAQAAQARRGRRAVKSNNWDEVTGG